jgi:hypothetical protein
MQEASEPLQEAEMQVAAVEVVALSEAMVEQTVVLAAQVSLFQLGQLQPQLA